MTKKTFSTKLSLLLRSLQEGETLVTTLKIRSALALTNLVFQDF